MNVESGACIGLERRTHTSAPKARVLVADDDPSVRQLLELRLTMAAFNSESTSSGEEALVVLERQHIDAVIADLAMPGISGLGLLKESRRKHPHLAFLLATGVNDVRVGIHAMKQGADDYLVKPFQFVAVLASVNQALEKKRLEREVENYRRYLQEMVGQGTKQLQAALKHIEQTYKDTLEALGAALDLRDNETAGHSRPERVF